MEKWSEDDVETFKRTLSAVRRGRQPLEGREEFFHSQLVSYFCASHRLSLNGISPFRSVEAASVVSATVIQTTSTASDAFSAIKVVVPALDKCTSICKS